MNKEIKEILEYFKKYVNDKFETYTVVDRHTQNIAILLDYITNLQEQLYMASLDIQELTERDIWCPSNCDRLINLQNRVNDLEDTIIDKHECIDAYSEIINNRDKEIIELEEESEEAVKYWQNQCGLRQKAIDKAISFINEVNDKEQDKLYWTMLEGETLDLLNILQGEDSVSNRN